MGHSTNAARPNKVALLGATGDYGAGILARAEELGIEVVAVTRSPHKFADAKPTTQVVEVALSDEAGLATAFTGCDGVISALGHAVKPQYLPGVWRAMKQAGVTKYVGVCGGAQRVPGEQMLFGRRMLNWILSVFMRSTLAHNLFEESSLRLGENDADGLDYVVTRPLAPTKTPFKGAGARKDTLNGLKTSIYDHGDFCLYAVAADTAPNSAFVAELGRAPIITGTADP